tara:strand:+ start:146 stop:385 length:240 start_codon:yes stop_codon:yes gene_type:complete
MHPQVTFLPRYPNFLAAIEKIEALPTPKATLLLGPHDYHYRPSEADAGLYDLTHIQTPRLKNANICVSFDDGSATKGPM